MAWFLERNDDAQDIEKQGALKGQVVYVIEVSQEGVLPSEMARSHPCCQSVSEWMLTKWFSVE
jgi:hypothetical protein